MCFLLFDEFVSRLEVFEVVYDQLGVLELLHLLLLLLLSPYNDLLVLLVLHILLFLVLDLILLKLFRIDFNLTVILLLLDPLGILTEISIFSHIVRINKILKEPYLFDT